MARTTKSLLAGARAAAPIAAGIVPFGLVAGAAVVDAGFRLPEAVGMAVLVSAGASQLAAISLFSAGAPITIAILTALVVNARFLIYSMSLAPVISPGSGRLRFLLGHLMVDQNYAVTMTEGRFREDIDVVPYYIGAWLPLGGVWYLTNITGALAGALVPEEWSLEFAVPLVFLAMLVPALKDRWDVETALVTGVAAAVLVPLLPMRTGLLVAIVLGMTWGAFRQPAEEEPAGANGHGSRTEGPR